MPASSGILQATFFDRDSLGNWLEQFGILEADSAEHFHLLNFESFFCKPFSSGFLLPPDKNGFRSEMKQRYKAILFHYCPPWTNLTSAVVSKFHLTLSYTSFDSFIIYPSIYTLSWLNHCFKSIEAHLIPIRPWSFLRRVFQLAKPKCGIWIVCYGI